MVATGYDHILILTKKGEVYSMGDDSFGQCGCGSQDRSGVAPFEQNRFHTP